MSQDNQLQTSKKSFVRRTEDELEYDRQLIFDLAVENPGLNMTAITELFNEIRGTSLSRQSVERDYRIAREQEADRLASMERNELVAIELRRLEIYEQRLLQAFDKSAQPLVKRIIDKRVNKDGEEYITNIREVEEFRFGDMAILNKLFEIRSERNKLLGLHLPQRIDVRKQVVEVKGYVGVNPDAWDSNANVIDVELE